MCSDYYDSTSQGWDVLKVVVVFCSTKTCLHKNMRSFVYIVTISVFVLGMLAFYFEGILFNGLCFLWEELLSSFRDRDGSPGYS